MRANDTCKMIKTSAGFSFLPFVSVGCLFCAGLASGQTNVWTNSASGYWEQPFWSAGALPGTNQDIVFTNAWQALAIGQSTVQAAPDSLTIGSLIVAAPLGTFSEVLMNYAGTNNPLVIAGTNAWQGALVIGTNSAFEILDSALQVQNGYPTFTNGAFTVGGAFDQGEYSTVNAGVVQVGLIGPGTYNLTNGFVQIGQEFVGSNYPSIFNQFGGTNTMTTLQLPVGGEYDLYGGVLTGTINLRDGAVNQWGGSYSGSLDFVNGGYSLNGGSFTCTTLNLPTHNYTFANTTMFGNMVQTGGTNFSGAVDIWGVSAIGYGFFRGLYTLTNGALFVSGSLHVGPLSTYQQSGGLSTNSGVAVDGNVFGREVEVGTFGLSGGLLSTPAIGIADANYGQSGGTNQVAGEVTFTTTEFEIDYGIFQESGSFSLTAGRLAASSLLANFGGAGSCNQSGGTLQLQQNLSLTGGPGPQTAFYGYVLTGGQLIAPNISVSNGVVFQHVGGTISNSGVLTLAAGTWMARTNQTDLGKLMLTISGGSTNSTISFPGNASTLHFADSSTMAWPSQALLTISNWNGSPGGGGRQQIFFGNNSSGLTLQQLKQIQFINPAGANGPSPAAILSTGEIVPARFTGVTTHYVSQTSPSPAPPYGTPQTAAHDIQSAVDVSIDGDSVLVEPGSYTLSKQITVTNGIRLQGVGGASQTFLNGQDTWCLAISNALVVADGFTFQSGSEGVVMTGATIQNCNFTNFYADTSGGAIMMSGGIVSNVVVTYNRGPDEDGVAVRCSDSGLITDSLILANPRVMAGGTGIALANSRLQNSVVSGALAAGNVGGVAVSAISSMIVGCTISNNFTISGFGGGAYLKDSFMDRCIVTGNMVGGGGSGSGGGGIFEIDSTIRNSLIFSNSVFSHDPEPTWGGLGGGVYMQGGALINCTVAGNTAQEFTEYPGGGAGVFAQSGGITNCVIYFNYLNVNDRASSNWYNMGPAIFDHCCTAPDPGGAGDTTQDPQLVIGYHLAATSSCVGTGLVQPWMIGAQDLDGNPRSRAQSVDMGAYEYRPYLSMRRSGANLVVSWPSPGSAGSILEQAASIGQTQNWITNSASVSDDGTNKTVTVSATSGPHFFRLYLP